MMVATHKPHRGTGMNGWVARWYARTRSNDLEEFRQQAQSAAHQLAPGASLLEVAPGPGFFSIELAKLGDFRITGLDVSETMVELASEGARRAGVQVDFRLGNASAMPFGDDLFDFIYCSAAFKNFSEPVRALDEMHRVLRPGGQAVIIDLRKDVSIDEIRNYVKGSGRRRIDAWMTTWTFRLMLIRRAYTQRQLMGMAGESRFGSCTIKLGPIGYEARFLKPS